MKIIEIIKEKLQTRFLKKTAQRSVRQKKYTCLNEASLVGLMFEIEGPDEFKRIVKFAENLERRNRKVICMGFTRLKEVPDYCKFTLTYHYVSGKNLNWIGVPEKLPIGEFRSTSFDILINLCSSPVFTLEYINIVSGSKLKVGVYNAGTCSYYDLMIHAEGITPPALYDQFIHYLETIKSS